MIFVVFQAYFTHPLKVVLYVYYTPLSRSVIYSVARMLSFDSNVNHFDLGNQNFSFQAEAEFLNFFQKFF